METKSLNLNNDDIQNLRKLIKVIEEGDFEIKGRAVIATAHVLRWAYSLEGKLVLAMRDQAKPKVKSLGAAPKKRKKK